MNEKYINIFQNVYVWVELYELLSVLTELIDHVTKKLSMQFYF